MEKTMRAVKEYNVKEVIVAGGVSANSGIREKLKELCDKENVKFCRNMAGNIIFL